jgi:hypothetical protein
VHDFNPGITRTGLFWTVRAPQRSVEVALGEARASMRAHDLEVEDYFDVVNALQDGPSVPARVSYDIRWRHELDRSKVTDADNDFEAWLIQTEATIRWAARTEGFSFHSGPAAASNTAFAVIGRERNGSFF